jgi:hypothetical protein
MATGSESLEKNNICPLVMRLTPPEILEMKHLSHHEINLLGCYSLFKLYRYISRNILTCIRRLTIVFLNEGERKSEPEIVLEKLRTMGEEILGKTLQEIEILAKAFEFDGVFTKECEPFVIIQDLILDLPLQIQNAIHVYDNMDSQRELIERINRLIDLNCAYLQLKETLVKYRREAKERIYGRIDCNRVTLVNEIRNST